MAQEWADREANHMISFAGKVAILTGAGGGIGAATARLLARQGAAVVLADLNLASAQAVADEIGQAGGVCCAVQVDIGEADDVTRLMARAIAGYGRIDVLINNAAALGPEMGPAFDRDVETTSLDVWDKAYRVNVRGTVLMCKHALPHMVAQGGGSIVNVASNLALQGNTVQNAYSATKAAVIQLSRCIAASHGRRNIRCNSVLPGLTMTPSVRDHVPPAHRDAVFADNLLPDPGTPEDLANTIVFVASDAARNITGQMIVCDTGNSSHVPGFGRIAAAAQS
jgi:NAD(P)-dependent dehydrogenase (short-subunit alcohol dehydrogenase family)